jgi:hypothetical protein
MVQILHVRLLPNDDTEEQIALVRWYDPATGNMDVATVPAMVKFIREDHGRAYVCNGYTTVQVDVEGDGDNSFIFVSSSSIANGLFSLPRF